MKCTTNVFPIGNLCTCKYLRQLLKSQKSSVIQGCKCSVEIKMLISAGKWPLTNMHKSLLMALDHSVSYPDTLYQSWIYQHFLPIKFQAVQFFFFFNIFSEVFTRVESYKITLICHFFFSEQWTKSNYFPRVLCCFYLRHICFAASSLYHLPTVCIFLVPSMPFSHLSAWQEWTGIARVQVNPSHPRIQKE